MELRHLRYFAAVAEQLSFTRAAAELRVAQPALSRQIRALEDEIGAALFTRSPRRVELTDAGRAFLEEARGILGQSEQAIRVAQASARGDVGRIGVGYVWGLFHTTVPNRLARLRERWPSLAVNLFDMNAHEQRQALASGAIDVGFMGFEGDLARVKTEADGARKRAAAELAWRRVGSCEFMIVLPTGHPAVRRRQIPLAALSKEIFIAISEATYPSAAECVADICAEAGFRPRVFQASERGFTILGLVAAGCGVALLPASLEAMPHAGVVFRHAAERPTRDLFVAFRRDRASPWLEPLIAEVGDVGARRARAQGPARVGSKRGARAPELCEIAQGQGEHR